MLVLIRGIITDTTKDRLQELEYTRKDLQEKLIFERMQEKAVLKKKTIENYLNNPSPIKRFADGPFGFRCGRFDACRL